MPRKLDPAKIDHAVQLYVAGETLAECQAQAGVSEYALLAAVRKRGIVRLRPSRPSPRRAKVDDAEIVRRYLAGESEQALGRAFGLARTAIRPRLLAAGVEPRGSSSANRARWQRATAEERVAKAERMRKFATGRAPSEETVLKRARLRELAGWTGRTSENERRLYQWLVERGESPIVEKAVGRYNLDFAVGPVAVELLGGGWHASPSRRARHAQRLEAIGREGWAVVYAWSTSHVPITPEAADYIVAFAQETRRNPSLIGQYRVIRGDGQLSAAGRTDDDDFALVAPSIADLRRRT